MPYREYNFDGLVGPTHNYAGLGTGNLASIASKHHVSSPKAAALEGLAKMKLLAEMGVPQAILPPHRRPHVGYLRARYRAHTARPAGSGTGLPSTDHWHAAAIAVGGATAEPWHTQDRRPAVAEVAELLRAAAENGEEGRRDLAIASSASAMWAANAATVSPSPDTADGRLHITPANLVSQPHRALEGSERFSLLRHVFESERSFVVHWPLSPSQPDEGGANHNRIAPQHGSRGRELFIYGKNTDTDIRQRRFPPRQSAVASRNVAEQHLLNLQFWQSGRFSHRRDAAYGEGYLQNPLALDAGAFHSDVVAVSNENVVLIHEHAWEHKQLQRDRLRWLCERFQGDYGVPFFPVVVWSDQLTLDDAVKCYLFNSQLVTLPDGSMNLIYPAECDEVPTARAAIERILREDNPVEKAVRVDVRQSMKNGGGPACLRLRVVLSDEERSAVRGNVFWTPQLHETLVAWVNRHYRDTLTPHDLADVRLHEESMAALDELAEILQLPI